MNNLNRCLLKHSHPSRSEAGYCDWLLARKKNKEIQDFTLYPNVELHVSGKIWRKWAIDFLITENDGTVSYHESKGWNRSDDRFRMKLAHFRLEYPDIPIYVNKVRVTSDGWIRKKEPKRVFRKPVVYKLSEPKRKFLKG